MFKSAIFLAVICVDRAFWAIYSIGGSDIEFELKKNTFMNFVNKIDRFGTYSLLLQLSLLSSYGILLRSVSSGQFYACCSLFSYRMYFIDIQPCAGDFRTVYAMEIQET